MPDTPLGHSSDKHAEELIALGLTSYEARAYLALVRRQWSTATQVARVASIPRQRVYDVLAGLMEKGLVSARPGRATKYACEAPAVGLQRLVAGYRTELEKRERRAQAVAAELGAAWEQGQQYGDPLEYIEVLRDRRAINERFAELQAAVEREILVFSKLPYAAPPQENVQGLQVAQTRIARSIYEFSALDDEVVIAGVHRFEEAGEQARFAPALPLKLVIIDERVVMFGMEDPIAESTDLTIVVVEHRALAQVLKIAFEAVWERALTLDEALKAPR